MFQTFQVRLDAKRSAEPFKELVMFEFNIALSIVSHKVTAKNCSLFLSVTLSTISTHLHTFVICPSWDFRIKVK